MFQVCQHADKIVFSQLFGWVISFEMKGGRVCPVDAGKREKAALAGWANCWETVVSLTPLRRE